MFSFFDIFVLQNHSVRNLPWHSAMPSHIYIFSICVGKTKCRGNWILRNYENCFSRIRKYILCSTKKRNVLLNKKSYFCFSYNSKLSFMTQVISCIIANTGVTTPLWKTPTPLFQQVPPLNQQTVQGLLF